MQLNLSKFLGVKKPPKRPDYMEDTYGMEVLMSGAHAVDSIYTYEYDGTTLYKLQHGIPVSTVVIPPEVFASLALGHTA